MILNDGRNLYAVARSRNGMIAAGLVKRVLERVLGLLRKYHCLTSVCLPVLVTGSLRVRDVLRDGVHTHGLRGHAARADIHAAE